MPRAFWISGNGEQKISGSRTLRAQGVKTWGDKAAMGHTRILVMCSIIFALLAALIYTSRSLQARWLCPAGERVTPGVNPLVGADGPGSCHVCCDRPGGSSYWRRLADWHGYCYPNRQSTPTRTPISTHTPAPPPPPGPPEDTPRATPPPPPIPPEVTPTWTTTPDVPPPPGTPAATDMVTPTATTQAASPPSPSATPTGIVATSTAKRTKAPTLECIPKHAARPVALCATGSGSGWWLYFIGPRGRVMSGPHVPYPSPALAGRQVVLRHYISGEPIWLNWGAGRLQVRTAYAGKPYHFSVGADGAVRHMAW